jgi:phosphatidylglycerophosphatase A
MNPSSILDSPGTQNGPALRLARLISTCGGIGYLPGAPGTYAALAVALLLLGFLQILRLLGPEAAEAAMLPMFVGYPLLLGALFAAGVWSARKVAPQWGKDPSRVVIDEAFGQALALYFILWDVEFILASLLLFRFFDIVKPLGIRRMERFKGGWGVMLDDALAGLYANLVLQLLIHTGWWWWLARELRIALGGI